MLKDIGLDVKVCRRSGFFNSGGAGMNQLRI